MTSPRGILLTLCGTNNFCLLRVDLREKRFFRSPYCLVSILQEDSAHYGIPYFVKLKNWMEARILSLKKFSTSSSPLDFHPIRLLCFLSKVLELAHEQIMSYLKGSKILDQYQTGFCKFHSTQYATKSWFLKVRTAVALPLIEKFEYAEES